MKDIVTIIMPDAIENNDDYHVLGEKINYNVNRHNRSVHTNVDILPCLCVCSLWFIIMILFGIAYQNNQ